MIIARLVISVSARRRGWVVRVVATSARRVWRAGVRVVVGEMLREALEEILKAPQHASEWPVVSGTLSWFVKVEEMKEVHEEPVHWCHAAAIAFCNAVS